MYRVDIGSENYPSLLKEIHNPPSTLYAYGNIKLLKQRCITIVGTRTPASYGKWVVDMLLDKSLSTLDICIVSGMAKGIDTFVHKRCLETGIPTIAVIGGGIDNIYPEENTLLYEDICNKGLVIAEFTGQVEIKKGMFPMRNRILAGISNTVIVIEADLKSGSHITAQFGLNEGRDIYAIPGDIGRNTSRGCNMLIKQGAGMINSKDDFMEILGIEKEQLKMNI